MQRYTRAFSVIREFLSKTAPDKLADAEVAMQPLWFDQGQFMTIDAETSFMRARKEAGPPLDARRMVQPASRTTDLAIVGDGLCDCQAARAGVAAIRVYVCVRIQGLKSQTR